MKKLLLILCLFSMTAHSYTQKELAECSAATSVASVEFMSQGNYEMKKSIENYADKVDRYAIKYFKKEAYQDYIDKTNNIIQQHRTMLDWSASKKYSASVLKECFQYDLN